MNRSRLPIARNRRSICRSAFVLGATVAAFLLLGGCASTPPHADPPCPSSSVAACPLVRVPPKYPEAAIANMAEGVVLLSFRMLSNGETDDVSVVYSVGHPVFHRAALTAVESWTYSPATKDGVPMGIGVSSPVLATPDTGCSDE